MKKTIFGLVSLAVIVLASCDKTNTIPDRFTAIPDGNTNVKFLNLAPGSPGINFFANGTKTSAFAPSTTGAETGMAYGAIYPSAIGYVTIPGGSVKIDAIVPAASTVMPGATLLSTTQNFEANKFYTVVLLDTFTQVKSVVFEDDPTVADATKAYLRVANFMADSAINIVITKTSADYPYSKTYNNVAPRTILAYDSLGAGSGQVYKIEYKRASNNALISTLTSFTPSPTKKYTFYTRGLLRLPTTNASGPSSGVYTNF
jgi:hypothetical protein